MKKELAIAVIIPLIFLIGIIAFFSVFPSELMNLSNFVAYMSSLSTIIMVLVYLFTNSRQLNAMRNQLEEMKTNRELQIQPLPFSTPEKAYIEAPTFWTGPPEWKMDLCYRIFIELLVRNIGNGASVAMVFIPEVFFEDKNGNVTRLGTASSHIDCLKEDAVGKISLMFVDEDYVMINNALFSSSYSATMKMVTLYKNVLGGSFKSEATYILKFSDDEKENLKSCLKVLKTSKIDYSKEIETYNLLRKKNREEDAHVLMKKVRKDFANKFWSENLPFSVTLWGGSFSVSPMTNKEYENESSK